MLGWHVLCYLMPKTAVKIQYRNILGYDLNLIDPKDLNEKINYLKFHSDLEEWARLADKYAVREYVKERGLEDILVPLYGKYDSPQELIADWNNLPNRFVIKTNNGCGTVKLVHDKTLVNLAELKAELKAWMNQQYGRDTHELHYLKIKVNLIVEAFLDEDGKQCPSDYKFWCFNGIPFCILAITGRDEIHHKMYRSMYDLKWNRIYEALPHNDTYTDELIPKPKNFEKMLECASILSKGHKEVRVDLYNIEGNIYFGEMTFTSRGGYNNYNRNLLLEMGKQFEVK